MDMDRNEISTRILNITLEIICLLTGEDYTVVKKTSRDCVAPRSHLRESGGWSRGPITDPPPHSLIHERNNKRKIIKLTHKMMELLTGEVTLLTGEDWEYLEGPNDLYEDIMMEDQQPLISQDGLTDRNLPKRCPSPLYSQDSPEEKHNISEDHQVEDQINIKVVDEAEVERLRSDQLCMRAVKVESPGDVTPEIPSEGNFMLSPNSEEEDEDIMQPSSEETLMTLAHNAYLSKNKTTRGKELPVELRDRIVSRHKSGEGHRKISAALKVPKSTVANVIYKWKKFGTTMTLPRAGRPTKLSNPGGKGRRKRGNQEPSDHSD